MDNKNTKSSIFNRRMVAGKVELSKESLMEILQHIDEELEAENLKATAMIYRGCALMLHGYDTRSTTDIDYIVTGVPMADFSRVIDRVAARSNPPFQRSLFDSDSVYLAKELKITKTVELKSILLSYVEDASVEKVNKDTCNPNAIDRFILEVEKRLV